MRIRAVVTIGLCAAALLSISACRVEQGAALFIGSERISQQRIDEVIDDLPAEARENLANAQQLSGGQVPNIDTGTLRGFVVDTLLVTELGKRVAAETGAKPDNAAADTAVQNWRAMGLDEDTEFVKLAASADRYRSVLFEGAKPAKPTDAEIDANTEQFERTLGQDLSDEERDGLRASMASVLKSADGRQAVGQQRQVREHLADFDVTANPRYGQSFIVIARANGPQPLITTPIPS